MRVAYQRHGGLSPALMNRGGRLDAELTEREAAAVRAMLPAGFFALRSSEGPSRARDAFHYELEVEDGDRHQHVTLAEADVPEALRPLLEWLEERAASRGSAPPKPGR